MDAVNVKDLTFSYDGEKETIQNISFSIPKGSYTTIIGQNGSGKSTIAKLLIGLLEAKSGTISIFDQPLTESTVYDIRSHIGIVFQNPDNQFIGSTVADDIAFG
ncbi:ATP-binding cassette domain-containing protein, partial [uncultured Dubosiella sp.]